jgi:hypothetical protein
MNILNFGFIILSPEHNIGGLKNTLRSIKNYYSDSNIISVVNKDICKEQMKEIKEICEVYKGEKTITSLINKGFEKTKSDWNILIIEGARVSKNLNKKYSFFINSNEDILFPLILDYDIHGYPLKIHDKFYNCTLNGICINKSFFKSVGKLTDNPLEISRKFWSLDALSKEAKFKAILGIKIC